MNYAQKKREERAQGDDSRRPAMARDAAAFEALPETLNQSAEVQAQLRLDRSLNQRKENDTGMPDGLKAGVEKLSGFSLDDVKVHYGSSQPAQLNALAYAQGTDIYVAPGQERHLPHEAWHVAQQKGGRVRPTGDSGGVPVNDDPGLEAEADRMGQTGVRLGAEIDNAQEDLPDGAGGAGVAQMGKKGRKGGRSQTKKQGGKGQRDKKKGMMGDPQLGDIFTAFWHSFKQKHGGDIPDYDGDYILDQTLADLVGGESESPNADKTVRWFFSRYLEKFHPDLYGELLGETDEDKAPPKDEDSDEDGNDLGGTLVVQSRAIPPRAVVQRVLTIAEAPISVDQAWKDLAPYDLDVSEEGAKRVLREWEEDDQDYDSIAELAEYLADAGYDEEINGEQVFIEIAGGQEQEHEERALDIITILGLVYGIHLQSDLTSEAIAKSLDINRQDIGEPAFALRKKKLKKLAPESWTLEDLEALLEAVSRFAPLLGRRRASSRRADELQEITTFGKFGEAVDFPSTLAETFQESGHIALYEKGTNEYDEEPDKDDKVKTLIHELTHGFLENRLSDFEALPYWKWVRARDRAEADEEPVEEGWTRVRGRRRGRGGKVPDTFHGEEPPNAVAQQSAAEDLSESVAMYLFSDESREEMRREYPERFAVVKKIVDEELAPAGRGKL